MRTAVVIRVRNEASALKALLEALKIQTNPPDEVIIVDSESTDGTREVTHAFGAKLVDLPEKDFSFGRGLNVGIEASDAEACVLVSAHCLPVHPTWISDLKSALDTTMVAGAFGRQVAFPSGSASEARYLDEEFGETARSHPLYGLPFSNANSIIRKAAWQQSQFDEEVKGSEDRLWAKAIQRHGWEIRYAPSASVYHSHSETFSQTRRRASINIESQLKSGGLKPGVGLLSSLSAEIFVASLKDVAYIVRNRRPARQAFQAVSYRAARGFGGISAVLRGRLRRT